MRQVAEDALAHSAVKDEDDLKIEVEMVAEKNFPEESILISTVEGMAKKKFPEEDRHHLIEAVMKAFKSGALSPGRPHSWGRARQIEAAMQQKQDELIRLKV